MTHWKRLSRLFLVLTLAISTIAAPWAKPVVAQQTAQATVPSSADLSAKLAAIEKAIDDKRKELGIPGASLVIVKDDKVIYSKGLGYKDFEKKIAVTTDTLFAIGSASKAFTALTAVMAADDGKLSLDDSPKKFLPYFKMRDPEADAKITLRDLLSHRSGLNRTDLAMATGMLTREELIRVVGMAKPTAKLGEKFQYQNVMYAAAGEMVARAEHSTWDQLIETRIFRPLGMTDSDTTVAAMQRSHDFSFGYDYNATTKETRRLPMRAIPTAAPAGAINSNARDMAQWLRFMLNGGVINGKRLVSEKGFAELTAKQINVAGNVDYGLGWLLRQRNGHKIVEHGGNIDGFNSQVAMMPDQNLGFVLLTNVTASPLGSFAMTTVWSNLVDEKSSSPEPVKAVGAAAAAVDPKEEVGVYRMAAGVEFKVTIADGKLTVTVPGQPPYPLEPLGGRRYKLADPAPDGFFATFRPVKDKESETELYIEQPQGNVAAQKVQAKAGATTATAVETSNANSDVAMPLKEMLGSYENEETKASVEIGVSEGKVSLIIGGQPPFPLIEKSKDKYSSPSLPDVYWLDVSRNPEGAISGIVINQPEGRFPFLKVAGKVNSSSPTITIDELLAKMVAALGGDANLRKHKSSVTTVEIDLENQGVMGQGVVSAKAPNLFSSDITLTALGKKIGTVMSYFDGTAGGQVISFAPDEPFTGKRLEDVKLESSFYGPASWKSLYKELNIKGIAKVGEEEAYMVEKVPANGHTVTDYISTKSFLLLRRNSVISSDTTGVEIPQTEYFSDYRSIDGVMIPFINRSNSIAQGDVVTRVKDLKFDVEIADSAFHKPAPPAKAEVKSAKAKAQRRSQ